MHAGFEMAGRDLTVNTDTTVGELTVCVSNAGRNPIMGFDQDDCLQFSDDSVCMLCDGRNTRSTN